jgi:glycosyltransferase involved in cell wall biosynthesis
MLVLLAVLHAGFLLLIGANLLYLRRSQRVSPQADCPSVSVLIPARNEAENLRRLLPSLARQRYPDVEVLVYDDGSEDETWSVIQQHRSDGIRGLRGDGPPPGWMGKVHALYQLTRQARNDLYLFLDADAELRHPEALQRLVDQYEALPEKCVLTALPRLRGGGLLLVSMVPNTILGGLPWPLVRRLDLPSLGALNGQCWMLDATRYHGLEPHLHVQNEVLEDVEIGRYLKREGISPVLCDVQRDVAVHMYSDFADAWRGFQKNAYLLAGGTPLSFIPLYLFFLVVFTLSPVVSWALLPSLYLIKAATDRYCGFPLWVTALAPLSYLLSSILQLDSAIQHWTGRVAWKGRRVATSTTAFTPAEPAP